MKNPIILFVVITVAVIGGLVWFGGGDHSSMSTPASKDQLVNAFTLLGDLTFSDYEGKPVKIMDFGGKPMVINAWAAWCPFCRKELVDFAAAQKEFGTSVAIVAIDRAESREVAKKYSDELGVTDDLIFLLDSSDSFYQSIGGFSMPETIFVDKSGNIVERKRGPMELPEIRERIQKIL